MSSTSSMLQDLMGDNLCYSRRLLLIHSTTVYQPPSTAAAPTGAAASGDNNSFDTNVIMVLSVLLCALICSLGLNSIIRCALRCSAMVSAAPGGGGGAASSARLANTGVKRKALKAFTTVSYSPELSLSLPGLDSECAICLSEFASGERVKLLPRCHHGFHARCIDKWLGSHSSCPTCRDCLIDTCHKIAGATCGDVAAVSTSDAHHVIIAPLEPEGLIRNYRVIS